MYMDKKNSNFLPGLYIFVFYIDDKLKKIITLYEFKTQTKNQNNQIATTNMV